MNTVWLRKAPQLNSLRTWNQSSVVSIWNIILAPTISDRPDLYYRSCRHPACSKPVSELTRPLQYHGHTDVRHGRQQSRLFYVHIHDVWKTKILAFKAKEPPPCFPLTGKSKTVIKTRTFLNVISDLKWRASCWSLFWTWCLGFAPLQKIECTDSRTTQRLNPPKAKSKN